MQRHERWITSLNAERNQTPTMFNTMRVTRLDGEVVEVHGRRADVIKFERRFKQPTSSLFDNDDPESLGRFTEPVWFFAWLADGRDREVPDFDEWCETIDGVQIVATEADPVPPTNPDGPPSA
jgi:hypothetical protein